MTKLSVNLNKIALLRNSRGRDYPNVVEFANKFIDLGVDGITIHPRQDERHITQADAIALGELLENNQEIELNIEGYPSDDFLTLVETIKPDQCTLVPDAPDQLTSDHGWNLQREMGFVKSSVSRLKKVKLQQKLQDEQDLENMRVAIFLDPDLTQVQLVPETGADRIELYTEEYAESFSNSKNAEVLEKYRTAAQQAQKLGIEVNAGHDLDLTNLGQFLTIDDILEVSIGHALTIECIEQGMDIVVKEYLKHCQ